MQLFEHQVYKKLPMHIMVFSNLNGNPSLFLNDLFVNSFVLLVILTTYIMIVFGRCSKKSTKTLRLDCWFNLLKPFDSKPLTHVSKVIAYIAFYSCHFCNV